MDNLDVTEDFFKGHDFEDRVLFHSVRLTGEMPVGYEGDITEADIAVQLTRELNTTPDFIHSGQFHTSRERGIILAAIQELDKAGYVVLSASSGPWRIHPTRQGRNYVVKWRQEEERKNKPDTLNAQLTQTRLRDAQEAWVEVAKLRRELQIAKKTLPSLIADNELRQRCEDLLTAEEHYDRVIREACVILENRVRTAIGANKDVVGTGLMEMAFGPKGGQLKFSAIDQEQRGVMELYRGVMAFFRNTTGHHIIDTYAQDDALRFVVWIDLLLTMLKTVLANANANTSNNQ
ncbi:MAG: TIGR02391 family protein [Ktedonobacter sp. 13_1_40CM_4_52_4]|nr:MAG: TIGR02391 family protein [Ktedonobacter sp. 13_1_40CM_4_52_4]